MLTKLKLTRDIVAMEAFSVASVTGLLREAFPALQENFMGFMRSFAPNEAPVALAPSHRDFLKEIPKHTYMDIRPLGAFVPEGLDATYLKYGDYLLAAAQHASKVLEDVLNPYSVYLAQLVSNGDFKLSSAETPYQALEKSRNTLAADMAACFKKGSTQTQASVGKVVSRNADWDEVFQQCEKMSRLISSVDRTKLKRKITECTELLTVVERKIRDAEMDGVSPAVVNNLSDGAYQVASELEFYSVVHYRCEVFVNSVNKTVQNFNTIMKR